MRGEALAQAVQSDIEKGLVPFLVRMVAAFFHFVTNLIVTGINV